MNVEKLGQVFTPDHIVHQMLSLKKNHSSTLEPSAGNGAFSSKIPCTSIEIDSSLCTHDCLNMDFFDYPTSNKFSTIIGNPPYVRTKHANLYVHFINKCLDHLLPNGELIFITPRDFLKATSSIHLNKKIYKTGTITDLIDLGDKPIFKGFSPNCIIWRFEKDNFNRNGFTYLNGMLLFLKNKYPVPFSDLFYVKVGAVSGLDEVFVNENGDKEFVCSARTTRKMYWNNVPESLKPKLLTRKIRKFTEKNWYEWGRKHFISDDRRLYVNCKTRKDPFFYHPCKDYDGSIMAVFPKDCVDIPTQNVVQLLNEVDWNELGFVCDGRYIFSQRSLESIYLPENFQRFYD